MQQKKEQKAKHFWASTCTFLTHTQCFKSACSKQDYSYRKGRGKEVSGLGVGFFCFKEEIGVHLQDLLDKSTISQ